MIPLKRVQRSKKIVKISMTDPSTDYIGARLFHADYKPELLDRIYNSTSIQQTIKQLSTKIHQKTTKSLESIEKQLHEQMVKITSDMIADMSSLRVLKMFAFTVRTLLARLYHRGIHVNDEEVKMLQSVAKEAAQNNVSLVFMPCHKSHIDYLVVSYVLYSMGIALPHIAAGDNLNLPFVGWVLRHNGAFFIRREWGGDQLYISIMKEYITFLLEKGYNLEAFIEGTRSRTGKLLQPKFGFIKLILETLLQDPKKDAIIVPVNIAYDKVIETPSYVNELLGTPKEKESISQLLNSINLLQFKWGRIDVRFGEPFSLRDYINNAKQNEKIVGGKIESHLLQALGYKILGDINKKSVIMPTALVGTVLLTLRGRGVGRNELIRKVTWLKSEIAARGGKTAEGQSSNTAIVERAVTVLSDLIGHRFDTLERIYYPLKRFELSYYRNQVIHLFVPEAIVSVAMYATIKVGGPVRAQRIPLKPKLSNDTVFLSRLLKNEFVYGSGGLEHNLEMTLDRLVSANVVVIGKDENKDGVDDLWVTLSAEERRTGRETFDFYCFLLWPFVETYWLCAVSLYTILPDKATNPDGLYWIDWRVFMDRSQIFGKTLYYEGDISYFESINKETIANAIQRLKDMGVVQLYKGNEPPLSSHYEHTHYSTNANTTWIALSKDWCPAESLPDAQLHHSAPKSPEKKVEWYGPLGSFTKKTNKSMFDDTHSISLTRQKDSKSSKDEYYSDETSEIGTLLQLSNPDTKKPSIMVEDTDTGFDSWSQLRPSGKLWEFCESIGRFRREGKNRRDTSTVANRVLRLAQFASQWNNGKRKVPLKPKTAKL